MAAAEVKRRGPISAEYRPPAPVYERKTTIGQKEHCLSFSKAPAYSMGQKYKDDKAEGPGPGYSYDATLTSTGKKGAPAYSFGGRPKSKEIEVTPGPGSYNSHGVKEGALSSEKRGQSVTIGQRTQWPFRNEAPPPNSYSIKKGIGSGGLSEKYTPSWSLGAKSDVGGSQYGLIKSGNPGPGAYAATDPNKFKTSQGTFTIQGRTRVKDYNTVKDNPGPGAYEPKTPKNPGKKGFSMGIKHSEYSVPVIIDTDVI